MFSDTTIAEMIKEQTDYEEFREPIQVEQGLCLSKVIHDNCCISHDHCCLPQQQSSSIFTLLRHSLQQCVFCCACNPVERSVNALSQCLNEVLAL